MISYMANTNLSREKSDCIYKTMLIYYLQGIQRAGRLTLFFGGANPPDERKEGLPMVTYADLIQFCILIVALVGLCYKIFKDKRN